MQCPSAIITAAQVFATASTRPAHPSILSLQSRQVAAAIFPMASEAIRMGRVRALRSTKRARRTRERERLEREAYARRLFSEAHIAARMPPRRQRNGSADAQRRPGARRRSGAAQRGNADCATWPGTPSIISAITPKPCGGAEREVFWPTDPWVEGARCRA